MIYTETDNGLTWTPSDWMVKPPDRCQRSIGYIAGCNSGIYGVSDLHYVLYDRESKKEEKPVSNIKSIEPIVRKPITKHLETIVSELNLMEAALAILSEAAPRPGEKLPELSKRIDSYADLLKSISSKMGDIKDLVAGIQDKAEHYDRRYPHAHAKEPTLVS